MCQGVTADEALTTFFLEFAVASGYPQIDSQGEIATNLINLPLNKLKVIRKQDNIVNTG